MSEIDRERGRARLVEGRELSAEPQRTRDVWWRPVSEDEVRTYKPGKSVAAQDLVMWKKDDANLLVRRRDFAEVLEIRSTAMVVTGVTSTPEVLKIDRDRWSPQWHRENGTWHLARAGGERGFEQVRGAHLMVHPM